MFASCASLTVPFWQLFRIANKNFGNCCSVSYWCCKFLVLIHPLYRDGRIRQGISHILPVWEKINNKP